MSRRRQPSYWYIVIPILAGVVMSGVAVGVVLMKVSSAARSHSQATPEPVNPGRHIYWEASQRPYVIVDVRKTDRVFAQKRVATVYYPPPHDREIATRIILEVYSSLAREIEATQPNTDHKLVSVLLYGDMWDIQHDAVCYLCDAGQSSPVQALPRVPEMRWRWRDPRNAPDQRAQQWYNELVEQLDANDPDGLRDGIQREIIQSMSRKYAVSAKEIHEATWRVLSWKMNMPDNYIPKW